MRRWLIFLLTFVACSPEKIGTAEDIAIFGLWETGEKPFVRAVLMDGDDVAIVADQDFELVYPDGERVEFNFTGLDYVLESQRTPQPGEQLLLLWYREADTASVSVKMPLAINNLSVTIDTLHWDETEESSIQWSSASSDLEFALNLKCLEPDPQSLPWAPGNFMQLYSGPQLATQVILQPESFSYFGTHELSISVLNEELRDAFFFDLSDIRGLLKQGPDNVSGGKGFITGVATERVTLEIE